MTNPFSQKARLIGVDRAQSEDGFGENGMPVDRGHPASFEEMLIPIEIVNTQIGGRLVRRVLTQICEKPKIPVQVYLEGAPRAQRATKFRLPA